MTIDRFKTGHVPPDDIPQLDYDEPLRKESEPDTRSLNSLKDGLNGGTASMAARKRKAKGTIFGMFGKKVHTNVVVLSLILSVSHSFCVLFLSFSHSLIPNHSPFLGHPDDY